MTTLKSLLLGGLSYSALLRSPPGEGGAGDDGNNDAGGAGDQGAEGDEGGAGDQGGEGDQNSQQQASGQDGGDAGGEGDDEPAPPVPDWKSRELNRKHRQLQEARQRNQALEDELAVLRAAQQNNGQQDDQQNGDGQQQQRPTPPARRPAAAAGDQNFERAVQEEAAKRKFNDDCNATHEAGKKTYGKNWDAAATNLAQLGGLDVETMIGVMATDDPAKVLYELGSNPDEYHRIIEMHPLKRQNEFAKMASKPKKAPPQKSRAAAPTDPVRGRTQTDPTEVRDDQDDETWFARRRAQKQKKFNDQRAQR